MKAPSLVRRPGCPYPGANFEGRFFLAQTLPVLAASVMRLCCGHSRQVASKDELGRVPVKLAAAFSFSRLQVRLPGPVSASHGGGDFRF